MQKEQMTWPNFLFIKRFTSPIKLTVHLALAEQILQFKWDVKERFSPAGN